MGVTTCKAGLALGVAAVDVLCLLYDIHVFPPSTLSGTWSSPKVSGTRPPPCSYFSLTMMDDHHVVLFGGSQSGLRRSSDVYMLDLMRMVSCVELTSHVVIAWLWSN